MIREPQTISITTVPAPALPAQSWVWGVAGRSAPIRRAMTVGRGRSPPPSSVPTVRPLEGEDADAIGGGSGHAGREVVAVIGGDDAHDPGGRRLDHGAGCIQALDREAHPVDRDVTHVL